MRCREFQNKHVAFVDDLLPAVDMEAMRRHVSTCPTCARQDVLVRRSLLLVHNLPSLETSPDFLARLNARIEQIGPVSRHDVVRTRSSMSAAMSFAALAASVAAVAYLAIETNNYFGQSGELPAVAPTVAVAAPIESDASPMTNAAFVASVSTGLPVWPAVLMAGQSPLRFANLELDEGEGER